MRKPPPPRTRARRMSVPRRWTAAATSSGRGRFIPLINILAGNIAIQPPLAIDDPEAEDELRRIYEIDIAHRSPHADVRHLTYRIAKTQRTRRLLEESDDLVETLSGHSQLRKNRRRGIPRFLLVAGPQAGLPLFAPMLPPMPPQVEKHHIQLYYGALLDELEWDPCWMEVTEYGLRPTVAILDSYQVRGILWMPAPTYYELNRRHKLAGRIASGSYDADVLMRYVYRESQRARALKEKPSRLCSTCGRYA